MNDDNFKFQSSTRGVVTWLVVGYVAGGDASFGGNYLVSEKRIQGCISRNFTKTKLWLVP